MWEANRKNQNQYSITLEKRLIKKSFLTLTILIQFLKCVLQFPKFKLKRNTCIDFSYNSSHEGVGNLDRMKKGKK